MDRAELISGIQKGDREAFNDFCREELTVLMPYARIFLTEEWAEDAVQDVLFSFWRNRAGITDGSNVRAYLMKSVYNRAMNYLRKENLSRRYREWNDARIAVLGLEGGDPERNPVIRNLFDKDLRKNLEEAITRLPPKCREVFMMSYVEDLTNKDISARLGISLSTVENHIYSALKQLRAMLSKDKVILFFALLPYLTDLLGGMPD